MDRGKINGTSGAVTMTMSESRFCLSRISRKREISSRLGSTAPSTAVCLQFIEDWGGGWLWILVILNLETWRVWKSAVTQTSLQTFVWLEKPYFQPSFRCSINNPPQRRRFWRASGGFRRDGRKVVTVEKLRKQPARFKEELLMQEVACLDDEEILPSFFITKETRMKKNCYFSRIEGKVDPDCNNLSLSNWKLMYN